MPSTNTTMAEVVTAVTTNMSFGSLLDIFQAVVPWLAISVFFGLVVYLIKRITNKVKRAKGGI